jgi:hypothetical protein
MHHEAALFLLGALGLAACSTDYTFVPATTINAVVAAPSTTTRPPAEPKAKPGAMSAAVPKGEAFDGIADARCAREASCDTIGNGQYGSERSCKVDMRSRASQELAAFPCPGGIDRGRLDACIGALDIQRCGNPLDGFPAPLECQMLCSR